MTWIRRRLAELSQLRDSARLTGAGVAATVPRFLRLVLVERYSPAEVFMLGLLTRSGPVAEHAFVSKERMLAKQLGVNPRECFDYTEDKLVFFRRCVEHGLATPQVRAALCLDGRPAGGVPVAHDAAQLSTLLAPLAPCDVVMKPVDGVHGHGVRVLRLADGVYSGHDGARHTAGDLVDVATRSGYRRWLFQDRLHPHRDLVALSGSPYLQTARVVSCVDGEGRVTIPAAWLRIIAGRDAFDNFNFGASGNLVGTLDLERARIDHVLAPGPPGRGVVDIERHPATGAVFADFELPHADAVRRLVERAAVAFAPLRTIGWDVAITDDGPSLIEGNVTWDPLPTKRNLRAVADAL